MGKKVGDLRGGEGVGGGVGFGHGWRRGCLVVN